LILPNGCNRSFFACFSEFAQFIVPYQQLLEGIAKVLQFEVFGLGHLQDIEDFVEKVLTSTHR
jgi:hypothetical protein